MVLPVIRLMFPLPVVLCCPVAAFWPLIVWCAVAMMLVPLGPARSVRADADGPRFVTCNATVCEPAERFACTSPSIVTNPRAGQLETTLKEARLHSIDHDLALERRPAPAEINV